MNYRKATLAGTVLFMSMSAWAHSHQYEGENFVENAVANALTVNVPAMKTPPNGLLPRQTPLFVTIGFDDNEADDAMVWITDYVKTLKNPAGEGNVATYDGSDVRFTFFQTTQYIDCGLSEYCGPVLNSWKKAYNEGHEIGNHTVTHPHGASMSVDDWLSEIGGANTALTGSGIQDLGLPSSAIRGYRNPYLEQNANTYIALQQLGMEYDSSIQDGAAGSAGGISDGTDLYWPYTMDNGSPSFPTLGTAPGLWQMPAYPVFRTNGKVMTGFDYNMWFPAAMTRAEFTNTLKHTLDLRLSGNRAPLLFGAHTGEYTPYSGTQPSGEPDAMQRRAAIEDFIQYALSLKVNGQQVVRIVSYSDILDWMKNPVPLFPITIPVNVPSGPNWQPKSYPSANTAVLHNGVRYVNKWYASAGEEPGTAVGDTSVWRLWTAKDADSFIYDGTITPAVPQDMTPGDNQTFEFTPNAGKQILDVIVDGVSIGAVTSHTFTDVQENHRVQVKFGDGDNDLSYIVTAAADTNGTITPSGSVPVLSGASQVFTFQGAANYKLAKVTVDGSVVSVANNQYSLDNVNSNMTIHASFSPIDTSEKFTISSVTTGKGTISPATDIVVEAGGSQLYTFTPDSIDYKVASVSVNGNAVNYNGNSYLLENISADTQISVVFKLKDITTCTAPAWQANQNYAKGSLVSHHGKVWSNKWWSSNEEPGSAQWLPWEDKGACK